MKIALSLFLVAATPLLALVSFVHLLYLEAVRLRRREEPSLEYFKEHFEEQLQLKPEEGALAYSLVKQLLVAMIGLACCALSLEAGHITLVGLGEAALLAAFILLLAGFLVPQVLYRKTSGRWLARLAPSVRVLALAVRPFTALYRMLDSLTSITNGLEIGSDSPNPSEELEALIEAGTDEGIIEEEDRKLIESVVAFGDKTVRQVMTPRPKIVAISQDATLEDARQLILQSQFSRLPVYRSSIDDIVGLVHVRDVFEKDYSQRTVLRVAQIMRPIRHVPETQRVYDLLRELQQNREHMVVVVDEYGQTAGIVTLEDILEEIVGEIRDEHEPALDVVSDGHGGYIVSGDLDLDRLHDLLEFHRPEDVESTTVGGLVSELLGHVPKQGEKAVCNGIQLEVLHSDERRVYQVRVSRLPEPEPQPAPVRQTQESHD